jgi:DHA2 family multidrug resistance protein
MSDTAISAVASGQASTPSCIPPSAFPTSRKFLIFGVMAFGQFMALIDIQIVAASLNDIQAGLSAGPDEISWVQTAYLMAELVMIPFSAFLGQALSTRWMFALSAGLFTVASALCGMAWDIQSIVIFRMIQGFVGGAMVPTVFATGYALFTGKQRALIPAILGTVSVLAPTLGPTVGGWITDVAGWRWIFYINIIPGVAVTLLSLTVIRGIDLPNLSMLKKIDYSHLVALAVCLGGVEYVLEEGQRHDWFSDPTIAAVAWASFVAFLLFIERSFYSGGPIVRLSPFRKPTFAIACVFNLVIGFGVYSSTYLVPVFLGRVRGFDSLQIGLTVFVTGFAQLASVVVASRLSTRVDSRLLIAVGLSLFSLSLWMTSFMTPQWGFWELLWPQLVRGFSVLLCIVPSVGMALGPFEGAELRYASGLFNLMRNLGGAIGIALVNVWLYDETRAHAVRLGQGLGENARGAPDFISHMAARLAANGADPVYALTQARAVFARILGLNTLTLGFDEVFRLMAWFFVAALVMAPFCKPVALGAKPPPDAH